MFIGLLTTQIIKIIPVNDGAPNFKKFNANIADSGCCPIAPAIYPEIESTASIPELTIVLPHFCANPLIEEITPLEDFPSFSIIKSIVSFTNTLTNAFCIDAVQAEINVSTHKNTKFVFPVKNKITYNTIDNACDTNNAFCPVLNTFKKIGINTTIEIKAPIEITPMYTGIRSGLAQ